MKRLILLLALIFCCLSGFTQCPDDNHPHVIDLGLPSGQCWSCCNVNATSPEEFGGYYAYGEYNEKTSYSIYNYWYCEDIGYYDNFWNWVEVWIWDAIGELTDISGMIGYDAAYRLMGNDWQMPTRKECEELVDNCTWEWTNINGVNGYKVTGTNGNYIFLPATGYKESFNHNSAGERGLYRSSNWGMIGGEAMTAYVIDFNSSEVGVKTTGYRPNGQSIRPIYTAKMGCYVNESYNEAYKNKEARGFTADGRSEIAITYTCPSTSLDENTDIKFYMEDQEVDSLFAGTIKEIQYMHDSISIIITAPKDFLLPGKSEYEVKIEITPHHADEPLEKQYCTYCVLRPCVIFIHGLRDNGELFIDMKDFLVNAGLYTDKQIYLADYKQTNTSSFYHNTHEAAVIKNACDTMYERLFESDRIICSKFDMVGHSMGGILARLYAQEVENGNKNTNRIITLNTPHYGSRLGNTVPHVSNMIETMTSMAYLFPQYRVFATTLRTLHTSILLLYGDDNSGTSMPKAITDLAIGSNAIMNLNGPNSDKLKGIPVHSICTWVDSEIQNDINVYNLANAHTLRCLLGYFLGKISLKGFYIYNEDMSDLVVSLESQKGGLDGKHTSIFSGELSNANHLQSPHWDIIHGETTHLLSSYGDETNYSLHGFPPPSSNKQQFMDDYDFIPYFNLPNDTSYISANIVPVAEQEYTHVCNINHSNDLFTYGIFAQPTDTTFIFSMENNHLELDLSDIESDELTFYLIGRTNYDALVVDSVVVNMNEEPTSIYHGDNYDNEINIMYDAYRMIITLSPCLSNAQWQLYSIDGSIIDNGTATNTQIVLNDKKRGIYILKLTKDSKVYTHKILF